MSNKTYHYAGIGARNTPRHVLKDMQSIAHNLSIFGWHLRTGGADGADTAFFRGIKNKTNCTVFLPWPNYNAYAGPYCHVISQAHNNPLTELANNYHPAWHKCRPGVRKLHARNIAIVLHQTLQKPVNAIICWTENGQIQGGTGHALRIAQDKNIPVFNLALMRPYAIMDSMHALKETN